MPARTAPHRRPRGLPVLLAFCLGLAAPLAHAFPVTLSVRVVEYFNVYLGHYFMTANDREMQDIAEGKAGPGWVPTGFTFDAKPVDGCWVDCGVPVTRFYGTPGLGPNSHFYTADPAEAQGLGVPGSGWTYEEVAFHTELPDAAGNCREGLVPVYRLYNNRWMYNDSNHRYVTTEEQRQRMRGLGWVDEGVRFCAMGASDGPIKSFRFQTDYVPKILPSAECEDESVNLGSCVAVNNLPPPTIAYATVQPAIADPEFTAVTGLSFPVYYVTLTGDAAAVAYPFVQGRYASLGLHVDTLERGPSSYSSLNPLYQMRTTLAPGAFDDRFFPWHRTESPAELRIRFDLHVKRISTTPGSAAYGHPTVEFIDRTSGHHVYFTVGTYGTLDFGQDYLAPDVATGKVIVGTTFRPTTPYGRSPGEASIPTPAPYVSAAVEGTGGHFEFRMDRAEFQNVIDAARQVDPALSRSPDDYLVDNFHFNNEVYGDGEIGLHLENFSLALVRR